MTPTVVLGNVRKLGLMLAIGAVGAVPVPVKGTDWGLPEASSVNNRELVLVPVVVGVNVTLTVQLTVGASVLPQVLADMAKSPPIVTEARFKVPFPVF